MKTDLTRAIDNYKKSSIFDSINEAIVNSIQASATKIKITIHASKSSQSDLLEEIEFISSVEIKDNGDGLNKSNRESFLTYLSSHKKNQGCKGIGRLSYLKTFKKVHISSKQNNELVAFDFTPELNEDKLNPKEIIYNEKETIITLKNPVEDVKYDLEKAYNEIYDHIYPFLFLNEKDCEIIINNDKKITRDDVKNIENVKFKIIKEINAQEKCFEFNLWYRFRKCERTSLDDFLCINSRPTKRFSNKQLQLKLNEKNGYQITFLLESDWINQKSNQFHDIKIEEDEDEENDNNQMFPDISWKEVRKNLSIEIEKLFNKHFPELQMENSKKINDLKEKYPHYADYIESSNVGFVDEKQLLDNAYKQARKEEQKLEIKDVSIEDIKKCVSNDLIRYILHRQKIIEKLLGLSNNKENIERTIHDLILKKGLEGFDYSPIGIKDNNLWLIDDKFMTYGYVASNKKIKTILPNCGLEGNSQDAPDIAIYVPDKNGIKKMVLIELKKFTATDYENGKGVMQLRNYSKLIIDSGVYEAYLYLLVEIENKDFRGQLEDTFNFKKIFSQEGEIWQGKFGTINAYIQIISPDAIIADAAARNKTFLDIIKNSKK